jgi:hypothetical protein
MREVLGLYHNRQVPADYQIGIPLWGDARVLGGRQHPPTPAKVVSRRSEPAPEGISEHSISVRNAA